MAYHGRWASNGSLRKHRDEGADGCCPVWVGRKSCSGSCAIAAPLPRPSRAAAEVVSPVGCSTGGPSRRPHPRHDPRPQLPAPRCWVVETIASVLRNSVLRSSSATEAVDQLIAMSVDGGPRVASVLCQLLRHGSVSGACATAATTKPEQGVREPSPPTSPLAKPGGSTRRSTRSQR